MSTDCNLDCASCGLDCDGLDTAQIEDERFLNSITDNFKVAIAVHDTMIANSVTMETTFQLYELNQDKTEIITEGLLFPMQNPVRAISIADYFSKMKINVIITGAISPSLKQSIEDMGIKVITGARGSHRFVIKQFISGKLN